MTVIVYDRHKAVGVVKYNTNLDANSASYLYSGKHTHMGIAKLKNPVEGKTFVLIHGNDYHPEHNHGTLITDEEARNIMLYTKKFDMVNHYFEKLPILRGVHKCNG